MASNTLSCSICAAIYKDSDDICSTVCGHIFHLSCMQQWQQRSEKCPMCNQINPQPHRIFLDLEAISDAKSNSARDCEVIIKGIGASQLKEPLPEVVIGLVEIMNVSISKYDIEKIEKFKNTLYVQFKTENKKDMFLENKYKLKRNPLTSAIGVHEVLGPETKDLFDYSHKLKQNGYQTIYIKSGNVFVRKERISRPICILSMNQVDTLCKQPEPSITTRPIQRQNEIVQHSTANTVTNWRSGNISQARTHDNSDVSRRTTSVHRDGYNRGANADVAHQEYDDHEYYYEGRTNICTRISECNIV